MSFTLIPALDIRGGRVVRLAQGDYATVSAHPEVVQAFLRQEAQFQLIAATFADA